MRITCRLKCYFFICANVIHRPWAVNWKIVCVWQKKNKKQNMDSLYLSAIRLLWVKPTSDCEASVLWSNGSTVVASLGASASQSVMKLTVLIRFKFLFLSGGHQMFMLPQTTTGKSDKRVFKAIAWRSGKALLWGGETRRETGPSQDRRTNFFMWHVVCSKYF